MNTAARARASEGVVRTDGGRAGVSFTVEFVAAVPAVVVTVTEPLREDAVCSFLTLNQVSQSVRGHQARPCQAAVDWGTVEFITGVRTVRHGVAEVRPPDAGTRTRPRLTGKLLGPALTFTAGLVREIRAVVEVVTADCQLHTAVVGAFVEFRGTFPDRAILLGLVRPVQTVRDPVTAELQGNTLRLGTVGRGGGGGALEV